MARPASSAEDKCPLLRAPLWGELLDRAIAQISATPTSAGISRIALIECALEATARAESRFSLALERDVQPDPDVVSESVDEAVTLMTAVGALWQRGIGRRENQHPKLVQQFRQRLSGHEEAVLAGEITYSLRLEDAQESAVSLRQALSQFADRGTSQIDLASLRSQSIDLAVVLLLAAANVAANGRPGEAPQERTRMLDQRLESITSALAVRAERVERAVDPRGDIAAHHLAAGLRVRVAPETLDRLEASSASARADVSLLDAVTDAWFRLATDEYVAVKELDSRLESPAYAEAFGSLGGAVAEGAANVVYGARLVNRPSSFRHRQAWGHQTTALTYALEAYIAGVRGDPPSLAQAQLITLTRLTRAIAAIAAIELRREAMLPANGRLKR